MADENEVGKKTSDGKGILIVLLVLVIVLIMVVAGGTYFLLDKISNSSSNSDQTKEELVTNNNSSSGAGVDARFKADVNELVLNLTDSRGREKIMKLSFSIRSSDPTIEKIVQDHLAEITDVVITQVSSRSSEELLTVGGKNQLKDELISEINNIINYVTRTNSNVVSNILFTTFVIK